jgi:hypothetical protein
MPNTATWHSIMVDEDEAFNRKKPVLPRPGGIIIREGGYMKKTPGVTGVGLVRPRSDVKITNCVLGLRAPNSLGNKVVLF